MKLIVGLGNPGSEYALTRHNAGRRVVEGFAESEGLHFTKKTSLKANLSVFRYAGAEVVLAYPQSYMNLSGESVSRLVDFYEVDFHKDLLVVVDDIALTFGTMRFRHRGSDGGHKGLRSIEQCLRSPDYPRLRLGIGYPEAGEGGLLSERAVADYVLSPFSAAEEKELPLVLAVALKACRLWIKEPGDKVMNSVNSSRKKG